MALAHLGDEHGGFGELGMTAEDVFGRAELSDRVREVVSRLPKQEQRMIESVYFRGMTLEGAASAAGLSQTGRV
jgi:DNA-directed RNA polymerase specialized sigma24 family protein